MSLVRKIRLLYEPWELDDKGEKRFGAWSQAYSGTRYWVMDPRPSEVQLIDIVQGLANAARYRGQTKFFYPVLTHCVLVSREVERIALKRGWNEGIAKAAAFEGLLHDAPEAYLGDVARPLKRMRAMRAYRKVEGLWENAIFRKHLVNPTKDSRALVHEIDHRIVLDEIKTLMKDPDMWRRGKRYVNVERLDIEIPELTKNESIKMFYDRFKELRHMNTGELMDYERLNLNAPQSST
jgi:5'-deoxynucleotidase YfbR-like HD superfamily hydrolase